MTLIRPTNLGGGGYSFNAGTALGSGWSQSYWNYENGQPASQAHHAAFYFALGMNSPFDEDSPLSLIAMSFGQEVQDYLARNPNASIADAILNFDRGDFRLGVAAGILGSRFGRNGGLAFSGLNGLCSQ